MTQRELSEKICVSDKTVSKWETDRGLPDVAILEELAKALGSKGKQQGGARSIRHLVQEQVEGPLAVYLLRCGKKPGKVKVKWEGGKVSFQS